MKERLLVLAKACPEISSKYQELVCVAGITDKGEWRRIYPIPWEIFWKGKSTKFRKKWWIEYELESEMPSDHRPESRKVKFDTIVPLREAPFSEILSLLKGRFSTIESLMAAGHHSVSLGAVIPTDVTDFQPTDNEGYRRLIGMTAQTTLAGGPAVRLDIPKVKFRYSYSDVEGERPHKMVCEDWEVAELYRNCLKMKDKGKYASDEVVTEKVQAKMLDVARKKEAFFVVGTHYRFNTFLIVGVVYPKKGDL